MHADMLARAVGMLARVVGMLDEFPDTLALAEQSGSASRTT